MVEPVVMPPKPSTDLHAALVESRARLVQSMVTLRDPTLDMSVEEARQFSAGFVHLVESAALGDLRPRDEYLAAVIPGIKTTGFPFDSTLDAMVRVSMVLTAEMPPEHRPWLVEFCGDYVRRLVHAWTEGEGP
jgi:hypothetical protein